MIESTYLSDKFLAIVEEYTDKNFPVADDPHPNNISECLSLR